MEIRSISESHHSVWPWKIFWWKRRMTLRMLWKMRHKKYHQTNINHNERNHNNGYFSWILFDEIRQKYFVVEIEKQNGEQEDFQVHQQSKLSENGIIHYQFKSNKNQPDNPVIDVDGFDAF